MAKKRRQRVKHYKRSFYSMEQRFKKGVALAVLVAVVLLLAWLAAPHVLDWATHTWYTVVRDRDLSASSQTTEPVAEPSAQPDETQPQATATPAPTLTPTPTPDDTEVRAGSWTTVDPDQLSDESAMRAVAAQLAEQGVTYALIPLKDTSGNIYYASQVAAASQSIAATVIDPAAVVEAFRAEGITPVAWLAAFRDPITPYTQRSMAIRYKSEYVWLDAASASAGGKPWLNPYADEAVQYIGDLVEEMQNFGFAQVVLGNVQFPSAVSSKQDFGTTGGATRGEQLAKDIAVWQARFAGKVTLWYQYPLSVCQQADNTTGALPAELGVQNLIVLADDTAQEETLDAVVQQMKEQGVENVVVRNSTGAALR